MLNFIYRLFCKIGLHQDVYGEGFVNIAEGVAFEHKGYRCIWCGRCKGAKHKESGNG